MKQMSAESGVPLGIAKKQVQFAHSRVFPLVAPSEPPILQVNLFKLTTLQCRSEPINSTSVDMSFVFVSCTINLVEIPSRKPWHTVGRFLADKLREEGIFARRVRGTVHGGELILHLGVTNTDHGGQAKGGSCDVRHFHKVIVPEQQNASTSAVRRPLRKIAQFVPS